MIVITYLIGLNILFPLYFFTEYREYSVLGTLIFDMTILISSKKFAGAYKCVHKQGCKSGEQKVTL